MGVNCRLYIYVHAWIRHISDTARQPRRALVSPFLESAKIWPIWTRAQPHFKSWGSESDEARIEGTKRSRFEVEARIEGEARERVGGFRGGGSASPSPEQFLEFRNSNQSFWCILEREILKKSTSQKNIKNIKDERVKPTPHVKSSVQNWGFNKSVGGSWTLQPSPSLPPVVVPLHLGQIWTINSKITFQHWVTFRYVAFPGKQWKYGSSGKIWPPWKKY